MNDLLRINIALKPNQQIEEASIALSRKLALFDDNYFVLDGRHFYPHVTIYAPVVAEDKLPLIYTKLQALIEDYKSVVCSWKHFSNGEGFINLEFDLTGELADLQKRVFTLLLQYRIKKLQPQYLDAADYQMKFSPEKLQAIRAYGSVAMPNFHPHLTLIRLKDEKKAEELTQTIEWTEKECIFNSIGIYRMGLNGTCTQLIKKYNFSTTVSQSR